MILFRTQLWPYRIMNAIPAHSVHHPQTRARVVLVTGASSGIGRATAKRFAEEGWRVLAGVRRPEDKAALHQAHPSITPITLDVTDTTDIELAFQRVQRIGRLDAVVNNAGTVVRGALEDLPIEQVKRQFETNCFGQLAVTQKALPWLRRSRGRVINLSSVSGTVASPFSGAYASSKFALEGLSDALRREVEPLGVKVVVIAPGPTHTAIWEKERLNRVYRAESPVYRGALERFDARTDEAAQRARPAAEVASAILKAATTRRPRVRYTVGLDSWLLRQLATFLPTRWLDRLILKGVRSQRLTQEADVSPDQGVEHQLDQSLS